MNVFTRTTSLTTSDF